MSRTFKQWQAFAQSIDARAAAVNKSVTDRAFALAAEVGIGRCMCSVHNASIDDGLTGWCFQNPHRLKVAKRVRYMLDVEAWRARRLADSIIARAWKEVQS